MAHKHSVYDTDLHLVIDPITRKITSESGKVSLMQNDHNSERFTFQIPRYVEGHDMSLCNVVQVHYTNTDSSNKRNESSDIYVVDDLQISPDSEDIVIGSWLVSQNATKYAGSLNFIFRFACTTDDILDYQWFSGVYSIITISKGIYNVDVVTNSNDLDLLESWKQTITAAATESTNAKYEETIESLKEIRDEAVEAIDNIRNESTETLNEANNTLIELNERLTGTEFVVNMDTGELEYTSENYTFKINTETGNLEWEGSEVPVDGIQIPIATLTKEKADSIVQTATGDVIVVQDSANDPLRGLRLFGKTKQFTTTGKNLFNPNNALNAFLDSSTLVISKIDTCLVVYIECEPDTTYTVSKMAGTRFSAAYTTITPADQVTFNGLIQNLTGTSITITTGSDAAYLVVWVYNSQYDTSVTAEEMLATVQIEKDDTATDYEPYTGGVASPNPAYPQELVSAGNEGKLDVEILGDTATDYESYKDSNSITILLQNGLSGIKVADSSLANYTDDDGQMWCCDEINLERGGYIQRIGKIVLDGNLTYGVSGQELTEGKLFYYNIGDIPTYNNVYAMCDARTLVNQMIITADQFCIYGNESNQFIGICSKNATSVDEFTAEMAENPITIQYILAEPIESVLTEEQIALFKSLYSYYPTTTFLNDSGAGMEVQYNADVKSYVDAKIAELVKLYHTESEGS